MSLHFLLHIVRINICEWISFFSASLAKKKSIKTLHTPNEHVSECEKEREKKKQDFGFHPFFLRLPRFEH